MVLWMLQPMRLPPAQHEDDRSPMAAPQDAAGKSVGAGLTQQLPARCVYSAIYDARTPQGSEWSKGLLRLSARLLA